MPIGELLLGAFFQVLFDRLASPYVLNFFRRGGLDVSLLDKLESILCLVEPLLNHAEEKQFTDQSVKRWLDRLKDTVYDAEDLLDLIATEELRRSMEARSESNSLSKKVLSLASTSRNPFRKDVVSKLNEITKKLEDMIKEKDVLGLKESVAPGRMPTTSLVEESEVYGRNKEKEQIIELLLSPETGSSKLGVIAIVGMGGLGKTTLAQLVYNDVRVKESFGFRSWISVSDVFDVVRVTKAILESITDQLCEMQDLERLQVKLREELKKKRSLIVLDDVWSESNEIWDRLKKPFNESVHGSKLLVTTRNEGVASVMGAIPIFRLKELSDEDGWSLFSQYAFENGNCSTDDSPLVVVGSKIVRKCKGLPLAIKTLASLLRSKVEITQWEDILNSSIWGLNKERNDIVPALRLSYHYLPPQLKRCFAYCAIFPKDYEIKKENLVLLWMAEGFVAQPENDRRIEDVGDEYFQELVSRSFFHQVLNEDGRECYMMHDLIHDLAQFMAGDFCFRLEEEQQCKSFKRARHIAYSRGQNDGFHRFEVLSKHLSLRTFLPTGSSYWSCFLDDRVPRDILPQLSCLRVLSLACYENVELPGAIGNLKQLRFLDLSFTKIRELPSAICTLYNLQALLLRQCNDLQKLPHKMCKLISLRCLAIHGAKLEEMPKKMGELKNLQRLDMFIVGRHCRSALEELGGLQHLRGNLAIRGLGNVAQVDDAREADMKGKVYLDELTLEFDLSRSNSSVKEMQVLENLRPHKNLKRLTISEYGGKVFPDWLGDNTFKNIVFLQLIGSACCCSLPPLGQLPSLQCLRVSGMKELRSVGADLLGSSNQFRSLEEISFEDMEEWESWDSKDTNFLQLQKLCLKNCPKLRGRLPTHLPLLRKVEILDCEQLAGALPQLKTIHELHAERCGMFEGNIKLAFSRLGLFNSINIPFDLAQLLSIKELEIKNCPNMGLLADLSLPPMLEYLLIDACGLLESLPECITFQTHLRKIEIRDCSPMKLSCCHRDGLPTSLESLEVTGWQKMELPKFISLDRLHLYISLVRLEIMNDVGLVSFPLGVLPKLRDLCFDGCENLENVYIPEGRGIDADQRLISLHKVQIYRCPKLEFVARRGLPAPNLEELSIRKCGNLKSLPLQMHEHLTSLKWLAITHCPGLEPIQERDPFPLGLNSLAIDSFDHLTSRWTDSERKNFLQKFQFLEILYLKDCTSVECFPPEKVSLPMTLKRLEIWHFPNLKCLNGESFQSLNCLHVLVIANCPKLQAFPEEGLPSSVSELWITGCSPVLEKRCQKGIGQDWPKISHIQIICIE
ncbi:hypothetical protein Ancab_019887 [Ancistrocladus abbreviatus]